MRSHFVRALLLLTLLGVSASAACVVRSHPSRSRHGVVRDRDHHDHKKQKHKKHKKQKKHRGRH